MAADVEFREFFFRVAVDTVSTKKDQQGNYPTKISITDCDGNIILKNNRFLKDHFPSEDVFKKLFESLTFKLNPEDTGTTNQQGLVRVAIGENVIDRLDAETAANGHAYTTVVVPSTLPIVSGDATTISVTPRIRRVSDNAIVVSITPGDRDLYYMDYLVESLVTDTDTVIDNVKSQTVTVLKAALTDLDVTNTQYCDILTHSIPAETLKENGDQLEYEWVVSHDITSDNTGTLQLYIGNEALTLSNERIQVWQDPVPYLVDHTLEIRVSLRRYAVNGVLVHIRLKLFEGLIAAGVSNIGTAINSATSLYSGAQGEEHAFTQHYIPASDVIDWDNTMKVMFRVDKGVAAPDTFNDLHTIIGRAIVNG